MNWPIYLLLLSSALAGSSRGDPACLVLSLCPRDCSLDPETWWDLWVTISIAMGGSCLCSGLSIGSEWKGRPWTRVGMSSVRSRQGLDQRLLSSLWAWLRSTGTLGWAISDCTTGPGILGGVDPCLGWKSIYYQGYCWSCRSIRCRRLDRSNRCCCRYSGQVQEGWYLWVKIIFSE